MAAAPAKDDARHIAFIDGLRAVAVLAVIAYHLDESWLPGGFVGVDVFFVISGFVVTGSLARSEGPRIGRYLAGFYARRLRRIAPALLTCVLVTSVATAAFVPSAWLSDANEETGLKAIFGLSNFQLRSTAGDYFSPQVELNPYTHTWSLGVEEQFYLVYPLLFFAWVAGRRAVTTVLVALGTVASLVYVALVWDEQPATAFYMLTCRFWELGAGALLFQLLAARPLVVAPRVARAATAAAGVVLVAGLVLARESHAPFPDGLLPVLGTMGLLAFVPGADPAHPVRRILESRAAVGVGLISYSLYLWHWPVFVLFRWTAGLESLPARALALAITFAAAVASYRLVERPFRYAKGIVRAPRMAVVAGGLAAVAVSAWAYGEVVERQPRLSLSVVTAHARDWYPEGAGGAPACARDAIAGGTRTIYSRDRCQAARPAGRLYVIGDSHAVAYSPLLRAIADRTGREVHVYYKGGCSVLGLRPGRDYLIPACRRFGEAALADMARRARGGDVLFLPSLRIARFSDQWAVARDADVERQMFSDVVVEGRRKAVQKATETLRPLVRRGVRVVFEGPTPVFRAPPFRCADWFNRSNPICEGGLEMDRALLERFREPVLAAFGDLARTLDGVSVWDPFPVLCPGETCHAMRGERPLFFDGDHVSAYGNRLLVPSFERYLRDLG